MTARAYPKKRPSSVRAKASLSMLLNGCTAERLAGFTAAGLSASYNVPIAQASVMLAAARLGRGQ